MFGNYNFPKSYGDHSIKDPLTIAKKSIDEYKHNQGSTALEWVVKIDQLLTSNMKGYEGYAELFSFEADSHRNTCGDMTNSLFTSAAIAHSLVNIEIPYGKYAPSLENSMNNGKLIQSVQIMRLAHIKGKVSVVQQIIFQGCRIANFRQDSDHLFLSFSISSRENIVFKFDQLGNPKGQTKCKQDYVTTAGSGLT